MLISDIIRKMLKDTRHSQRWLAQRMGYAGNSGVNNMLHRGNMMIESLWEICAILGYEIVIQPRDEERHGPLSDGKMLVTWRTRE